MSCGKGEDTRKNKSSVGKKRMYLFHRWGKWSGVGLGGGDQGRGNTVRKRIRRYTPKAEMNRRN